MLDGPAIDVATRVVTDSTACLPDAGTDGGGPGVPVVVPLHVLAGDDDLREGVDVEPAEVARRIAAGERLTTSQPSPEDFARVFRELAAAGARSVVTVHISGELSGTVQAAQHAGQRAIVPVTVVDSHTVAMALGFAAREAARCAAAGFDAEHVAARAVEVAASSDTWFLVDSLDHLRRGGRLSGPAAAIGTALGVRPLLGMRDGRIVLVQRLRTRKVATDRLVEVAVRRAETCQKPGVAVHHLGAAERAGQVAEAVQSRLGVEPIVTPVSAVLGAHAGPGALAVVVAELGGHEHG